MQPQVSTNIGRAYALLALAGAMICWATSIVAAPNRRGRYGGLARAQTAVPALPAGPFSAVAAAVSRPPRTPPFPYGREHAGTQAVYFLLRTRPASELDDLCDVLHRDSAWLRQLTEEARRQGFDPLDAQVQIEGGALLWQLVPFEYPPLRPAAAGPIEGQIHGSVRSCYRHGGTGPVPGALAARRIADSRSDACPAEPARTGEL